MILTEKQIEMYKRCVLLNENLTKDMKIKNGDNTVDNNILIENVSIINDTDKSTNLKYKGLSIKLHLYKSATEEQKELFLKQLDENKSIINQFDKLIDKEFESLMSLVKEWDVPAKNVQQLKRLCTMDSINFYGSEKYDPHFDIWFNNERKHQSDKFFGHHSFIVSIDCKNGKVIKVDSELAG